jgi:hypothetical protein
MYYFGLSLDYLMNQPLQQKVFIVLERKKLNPLLKQYQGLIHPEHSL